MSRNPAEPQQDFSPYAHLVAALLPRATGLSIFEPDGELRWTSEEAMPSQLPTLVARAAALAVMNDQAGERVQLRSSEPVYLFFLRGERGLTAVLSVRWRSAENDPRTFAYVHAMLRPVIDCLKRELHLHELLAGQGGAPVPVAVVHDTEGDNADLQVLLTTADTPTGGDIALLLHQINSHMHCEFTALMMPERNLVVVTKAEGREVDTSVLARAHRQLMSVAQMSKEALLLNEADSLPGTNLPLRALVSTVRNPAGRISAALALFRSRDAGEFRRRDGLLADLLVRRAAAVIESRYDALTGLFTRQAFEPRARALMTDRPDGPWSFLYVDADRLQAINDNHGMQVGDRLLVKLGELIRARLSPGAVAARISGDRFAILLPAAEEDAVALAEGLRTAMEALPVASLGATGEVPLTSSLSIGVAQSGITSDDPMEVLAAADAACRSAKRQGRNRVERFQPDADSAVVAEIGAAIAEAEANVVRQVLDSNRLSLHAQLIAPLPGNAAPTPHFELLLRVHDEQGEPVGPGRFLADAKRLGMMSAVDRWVVRETLTQLKPRTQLLNGGAVVLTVNISGQSLEPGFADELVADVQGSGIDPKALCFEFGEPDVIEHFAPAEALMQSLRKLGCHIALDDFGTGSASLANLRELPLSMLKIDGSFVRDVLKDPRAEGMVQGIAKLARSAGLATVAECVETDEIRLRLTGMGVDYGQGFAIARPVPLADAIRDLSTWASVSRQRQGSDVELGNEDDTVSAALQKELQREMLAHGIDPDELDDDLESAMQQLITASAAEEPADENHSELLPRQAAG